MLNCGGPKWQYYSTIWQLQSYELGSRLPESTAGRAGRFHDLRVTHPRLRSQGDGRTCLPHHRNLQHDGDGCLKVHHETKVGPAMCIEASNIFGTSSQTVY
jgi:hypothetical protein